MMDHAEANGRFEDVYAGNRAAILRYLERMTGDPDLAEDLAQETFARVARGLDQFRGESKLTTWLYRIATNAFLDHRRRLGTRTTEVPTMDLDILPDESSDIGDPTPKLPDRLLDDSEMGRCVREFVDGLPPEHRAVIVLHDLEGFKNREIAEILGYSLGATKVRVHRARQRLREVLGENCEFYRSEDDVLQCGRKSDEDSRGR
jgi:RNA polymerase sigma-70 factor (ECF subfamily)